MRSGSSCSEFRTLLSRTFIAGMALGLCFVVAQTARADMRKFDMGTEKSATWPDFTKVTHKTVYSAEQGYGWRTAPAQSVEQSGGGRVRNVPDVLTCDIVAPCRGRRQLFPGNMEFILDVPNGEYGVYVMLGDYNGTRYQMHGDLIPPAITLAAEGNLVFKEPMTKEAWSAVYFRLLDSDYRKGQDIWEKLIAPRFQWTSFRSSVRDGQLNLEFSNTTVNALVVYPVAEAAQAETFIAKLDQDRKASFPLTDQTPKPTVKFQSTPEDEKRGYGLFFPNYLEDIRPFDLPRPGQQSLRELRAFATLGEFEPVVFVVRPLKDLKNCRVEVSDLRSPSGAPLQRSCWDVRVVRYIESTVEAGKNNGYIAEPLVLLRHERHQLDEGINKEFWLTVQVPENAEPGLYRGDVVFRPEGAPSTTIPLVLRVLPFPLKPLEAGGRYQGNWHNAARFGVDDNAIIRDLKNHGMNVIHGDGTFRPEASLVDGKIVLGDTSKAEQRLDLYRKAGFNMDLIVWQAALNDAYRLSNEPKSDPQWIEDRGGSSIHQVKKSFSKEFEAVHKQLSKALDDLGRQRGWPRIYFYEGGEGGLEGYWGIWTETQLLRMLKEAGVKGTSAIVGSAALESALPYLHAAQFAMNTATAESLARIREAGVRLWIYAIYGTGLAGANGEASDRFLRGVWFWRTGAEGCAIESYVHTRGDPFDELDGGGRHIGRVFPTPDGPAPTPSWERIREGVDDARYIGHLDLLIEEKRKSADPDIRKAADEARKMLDGILAGIPADFPAVQRDGIPSGSQLDVWRWRIADQILKLGAKGGQ